MDEPNHQQVQDAESRPAKIGTTGFELFLFSLTRIGVISLAAISVLLIVVVSLGFLGTFHTQSIEPIHYAEVAPPTTRPNAQEARSAVRTASGDDIASADDFPPAVAKFLLAHQDFDLSNWFANMKPAHKRAFLENLNAILSQAEEKMIAGARLEKVVRDYAVLWKSKNERNETDRYEVLAKQAGYVSTGFGLAIVLAILCLILVLLAVERNTRMLAQRLTGWRDTAITPEN